MRRWRASSHQLRGYRQWVREMCVCDFNVGMCTCMCLLLFSHAPNMCAYGVTWVLFYAPPCFTRVFSVCVCVRVCVRFGVAGSHIKLSRACLSGECPACKGPGQFLRQGDIWCNRKCGCVDDVFCVCVVRCFVAHVLHSECVCACVSLLYF